MYMLFLLSFSFSTFKQFQPINLRAINILFLGAFLGTLSLASLADTPPSFSFPTKLQDTVLATTEGSARQVELIDVDNDGFLDAVILGSSKIIVHKYTGNGADAGFESTDITLESGISGAFSMDAVDVDDDGDTDIVAVGNTDSTISVLINNGDGTFTSSPIDTALITTVNDAVKVKFSDFDSDGEIDIVVASQSDQLVHWFKNNGSELFTQQAALDLTSYKIDIRGFDIADFDNDSNQDLVVADEDGDQVLIIFLGSSREYVSQEVIIGADTSKINDPKGVYVFDLDGNGGAESADVIILGYSAYDVYYAKHNLSSINPTKLDTPVLLTDTNGYADVAAIADVNNDTYLDIIISGYSASKLAFYPGNIIGTYGSAVELIAQGTGDIALADIDQNGAIDIFATDAQAGKQYLSEGIFFTSESVTEGTALVSTHAAMDANSDPITYSVAGTDQQFFTIDSSSGALSFSQAPDHGSVNAGGDDEYIVITNATANGKVGELEITVLVTDDAISPAFENSTPAVNNQKNAVLSVKVDVNKPSIVYGVVLAPGASIPSSTQVKEAKDGLNASALSAASVNAVTGTYIRQLNFNGLNIENTSGFTAYFVAEDTAGNLSPVSNALSIGAFDDDGDSSPNGIDVDDDADGVPDSDDRSPSVYGANDTDADGVPDYFDIFGTGYSAGVFVDINGDPIDTDGDGISDYAETYSGFNDVPVFDVVAMRTRYERDIIQTTAQIIDSDAPAASALKKIDFDMDGDLDLVIASGGNTSGTGFMHWYENLETGNFIRHLIRASDKKDNFDIGDIDGDGDLDIALSERFTTGRYAWLENDGRFNFTRHQISTSSENSPQDVQLVDFDNDGDLDIIGSSTYNKKVLLFSNDGASNFVKTDLVSLTHYGEPTLAVNLDDDAELELLVTDSADLYIYDWFNGEYQIRTTIDTYRGLNGWHLTDFDTDGDIDILSTAQELNDYSGTFFRNAGDLNFTRVKINVLGNDGVTSLDHADIDGDGQSDVVIGSPSGYTSDIKMHYFKGSFEEVDVDTSFSPSQLAILDGNADGYNDVLAIGDGNFQWYQSSGHALNISVPDGSIFVTNLQANDSDGQTLSYSIAGTDASLFTVNSSSGELVFNTAADVSAPNDVGNNNVYNITISASDSLATTSIPLSIAVSTDSTAPTFENSTPNISIETDEVIQISVDLSEPANVYAVMLPEGDVVPSATQIKNGQNANGFAASGWADGIFNNNSFDGTLRITNFVASTPGFDIYVVADDPTGNVTPILGPFSIAYEDNDADGVVDRADAFPNDATEFQDVDGDGTGDNSDAFPEDPTESIDTDNDGIGNNTDDDDDNDGTVDGLDDLPLDASDTIDTDEDGIGNTTDSDDDGDGVPDSVDTSVLVYGDTDTDSDGVPDYFESGGAGYLSGNFVDSSGAPLDGDNDGVSDYVEAYFGINDAPNFDAVAMEITESIKQSFASRETLATNIDAPRYALTIDFDLDGDSDIIVSTGNNSGSNGRLYLYENVGKSRFVRHLVRNTTKNVTFSLGDLDGDGDPDIAIADRNTSRYYAWIENDTAGLFPYNNLTTTTEYYPVGISIADMNGDGILDILGGESYDDQVFQYLNDGNNNYTRETLLTGVSPSQTDAFDLDGDDVLELIVNVSNEYKIYKKIGSSWGLSTTLSTGYSPNSSKMLDFDGDGDIDILYTSRGSGSTNGHMVTWFRNDGSLSFTKIIVKPTSPHGDGSSLDIAQINNDGSFDIAAIVRETTSSSTPKNLAVYYQNDGDVVEDKIDALASSESAVATASIDIDSDGENDLIVLAYSTDKIYWYRNQGAKFIISLGDGTTNVANIAANDPDGHAVTYSISGTDASLFTLDANTGELAFNSAPDVNSPSDENNDNVYELKISASDGIKANVRDFLITITNDNTAPVFENSTPSMVSSTSTLTQIDADMSENGTVFSVLVAIGSGRPTTSQIRTGKDALGDTAFISKSDRMQGVSFSKQIQFSGYPTQGAGYDIYFYAEDDSSNRSGVEGPLTISLDSDGDGVPDNVDAFPNNPSESIDSDNDGVGDNSDQFPNDVNESSDVDGDGVGDNADAFPNDGDETSDQDNDGIGDNSDTDRDGDGVINTIDVFPNEPNESIDTDGDGIGNNTDSDDDNDGIPDTLDTFPLSSVSDRDSDGVIDEEDTFPDNSAESSDLDGDGIGDNSDTDRDGDGYENNQDAFPNDGTETSDSDGDGVGDNSDAFPDDANETRDTDGDGIGNSADPDDDNDGLPDNEDASPLDPRSDTDGDGVSDNEDAFPSDPTESTDSDGDGIGNNRDTDDDNDGILDTIDSLPLDVRPDNDGDGVPNDEDVLPNDASESSDLDGDGIGDNTDTDRDGDGVENSQDAFPSDPKESVDTDGDGVGDNIDAFPNDPTESIDSDGDGTGNNRDDDDDNDGILDANDTSPLDVRPDRDGDGVPDDEDVFPDDVFESSDLDNDRIGDNADTDRDGDGVANIQDAFPNDNSESADTDRDGIGDNADVFPDDPTENIDTDGDGVGDNRDSDDDNDGIIDDQDSLRTDARPDRDGDGVPDDVDAYPDNILESSDIDGDGIGDNSDEDRDGDGVPNVRDAFPDNINETSDSDRDGTGDNADVFPNDPTESIDTDGDGVGDNRDNDDDNDGATDALDSMRTDARPDTDGDGVADVEDDFPDDSSESNDLDGDGIGDNTDTDRDGDGVNNSDDAFPEDASESVDTDRDGVGDNADVFDNDPTENSDADGDGIGNNRDDDDDNDGVLDRDDTLPRDSRPDRDGDGVPDDDDAFPNDANDSSDLDGDGIGDNTDADIDGDGVRNESDVFMFDITRSGDTDGDGIDDNIDEDIDGDGVPNAQDIDANGDGIDDLFDANQAPILQSNEIAVDSKGEIVIDVLDSATDRDGDILSILSASTVTGTVRIENGLLVYIAADNYTGTDTISYVVQDEAGNTSQTSITINVDTFDEAIQAPLVLPPEDVAVNATGYYTKVDLGIAQAFDSNGNSLPVSLVDGITLFRPGSNVAYWEAIDENGRRTVSSQQVDVRPLVSFSQNQKVREGNSADIEVLLNGPSPEYPVSVKYRLAGTANSDDHDLIRGELLINEGQSATIRLQTIEDNIVEGNESLVLEFYGILNSQNETTHTIEIVEQNLTPHLSLISRQQGSVKLTVAKDQGPVTVQSLVQGNLDERFSYTWDIVQDMIDIDRVAKNLTFDPNELQTGVYNIALTLNSDNAATPNVTATLELSVVDTLQTLTSQIDTDGDGVSDNEEGYGDSDGDGVPDYADSIDESNVLPSVAGNEQAFLIEGEPGVDLRIGKISVVNDIKGVVVPISAIQQDIDYPNIGGVFDFEIRNLPVAGQSSKIVLPQQRELPNDAVYRKYHENEGWRDFVIDDNNAVASTLGEIGYCPPANSDKWQNGLQAGHFCVLLTIEDGGPNDADGLVNGTILDPSGVSILGNGNQLPIAYGDSARVLVNQTVTIDVLNNDVDPDGDQLDIVQASSEYGDVLIENGRLLFIPRANYYGNVLISYAIDDGYGIVSNGTVYVDIFVNTAPIANHDTATTNDRTAVSIDVLTNDTDNENDMLTLVSAMADSGSVRIENNNLIYTPIEGFSGSVNLVYQVSDELGATNQGEVLVIVAAYQSGEITNTQSKSGGGINLLMILLLSLFIFQRSFDRLMEASSSSNGIAKGNWISF